MNAFPIPCDCCGDTIRNYKSVEISDADFGDICIDCHDGIVIGLKALEKEGVAGCYRGPCPDNEGGEP